MTIHLKWILDVRRPLKYPPPVPVCPAHPESLFPASSALLLCSHSRGIKLYFSLKLEAIGREFLEEDHIPVTSLPTSASGYSAFLPIPMQSIVASIQSSLLHLFASSPPLLPTQGYCSSNSLFFPPMHHLPLS